MEMQLMMTSPSVSSAASFKSERLEVFHFKLTRCTSVAGDTWVYFQRQSKLALC